MHRPTFHSLPFTPWHGGAARKIGSARADARCDATRGSRSYLYVQVVALELLLVLYIMQPEQAPSLSSTQ